MGNLPWWLLFLFLQFLVSLLCITLGGIAGCRFDIRVSQSKTLQETILKILLTPCVTNLGNNHDDMMSTALSMMSYLSKKWLIPHIVVAVQALFPLCVGGEVRQEFWWCLLRNSFPVNTCRSELGFFHILTIRLAHTLDKLMQIPEKWAGNLAEQGYGWSLEKLHNHL